MMIINDTETIRELQELHPRYETALVENDTETLLAMFWASPYVVRFGAPENLHGFEEIESFRKGRPAVNLARTVNRIGIVAFGGDFGSIHVEFSWTLNERIVSGRQSQRWVRLEEGWRIVSAHVSGLS
jgi:Protein of unknown function (DUF3225)